LKPHPVFWSYTIWPVQAAAGLVGMMIQVTETAKTHATTVAMNEALIISSVRQHELTEAAENLNLQLQMEIAERKEAETALRASEERYRSLFNSMDQGFCIVEVIFDAQDKPVDLCYLEVNPSFNIQTGLENALGKRASALMANYEAHWLEGFGKVARTGEPVRFSNEVKALKRWFEVYAFRLGGPESRKVAILFTNITERRRSEEALSEKARLIDLSNDAIVVRDPEDKIRLWNKGAEKLFGWTFEEVRGKDLHSLLQTEFSQPKEEIIAQLHRTGRFNGEVVQIARDGRRVRSLCGWVLDRSTVSIFTSYTDITARTEAEEALRKSEARYEAIVAQATAGIAEIDLTGKFTAANGRFCAIVGRTPAELRELRVHDITHPDDLLASAARFKSVAMGGADFSLEKRYLRPDGTHVWVSNSVAWIVDRDEVPHGFVEIAQDISERKRLEAALQASETYFRELTQSLPIGVWTSQPDGPADFINRHWLDYTGQTFRHGMAHPEVWANALHPDDRARVNQISAAAHAAAEGYTVEARFREASSGDYRWFQKRSMPVRDADGRLQKRIGICIDIDDLKRAQTILADHAIELEKQVQARTEELRETIGELEAFSYSVSHDMRAPLRAMQGFALLLLKNNEASLDAASVDQLRRIRISAARMDALINDVLTYSRLLRSEIVLQPVRLDDLVRLVIATYPHLQANGAEIAIEGTLPVVLANEAGLTQCISNLLTNAVKFVAPGTAARVRLHADEIEGDVRLWIEDNGIGIDARDHQRIWNIFTQVGRAKDYQGTGIGLAIARKAIERMHGTIGLESAPGRGSRFWLRLRQG
ncbi:MAG: PAS domain S-box protein, partial [Opitutaceae bacterium]